MWIIESFPATLADLLGASVQGKMEPRSNPNLSGESQSSDESEREQKIETKQASGSLLGSVSVDDRENCRRDWVTFSRMNDGSLVGIASLSGLSRVHDSLFPLQALSGAQLRVHLDSIQHAMTLVDRQPEAEVRLKGGRQGMPIGDGRLSLVFRVLDPGDSVIHSHLVDVRRDVRSQKKNAKEGNRRQPLQDRHDAFPKGQCDERSASGPVVQEGAVLEDRTSIGVKETSRFSLDGLKGCRWGHDEK